MRRIRTIAVLPVMLTIGNLICGFFAIVVASRIDPRLDPAESRVWVDNANMLIATCLIFAAMVFDALDGQVARLSHTTSDFGAQLDSLSDMVTFGVAPGFLMVKMCPEFHFFDRPSSDVNSLFPGVQTVWIIAALFAACAAMRLARFNVESTDDDDHMHFNGLPSPAAAATVASFGVMFWALRTGRTWWLEYLPDGIDVDRILQGTLPFFAGVVALLMVSRIPYPHIVNQFVRGHRSFSHVVRMVFILMAALVTLPFSIPVVCCFFVLASPLRYVWEELVQRRSHEEPLF